jgi:predicted nucleic acid-binding protein
VYLLDTNTVRYGLYEPGKYPLVAANLTVSGHETWISVVTAQELIAWRYSPLLTAKSQQRPTVLRVYRQFLDILEDICSLPIKPFDATAMGNLSGMPGNVGIQDRRIAATALANDFTVVTHNREDFEAIQRRKPTLKIVDWVDTAPAKST